jgi:TIR domain
VPPNVDLAPENPQVFISYAAGDVARAEALHARLVAAGFAVWFDKARLAPGCDWHRSKPGAPRATRPVRNRDHRYTRIKKTLTFPH